MIAIAIVTACIVAWIFLLIPSIIYLKTAWQIRFETLKAGLGHHALKLYFGQFFPAKKGISGDELGKEFEELYYRRYGQRLYIIPLILLMVISAIGIFLVGYNLFSWLKIDSRLEPISPVAIAAFLGAYMWVAYDQIQRFRMRDFTFHDVNDCSFRFLIAIPLGFSFAAIFKESVGVTSAFFLGTFPSQTLFKFGRRFITEQLKVKGKNPEEPSNELEQLQCINREEAERYREEGKTTILQLAYSDPVDLTMRTNFDFNYVVDCISQALLWLYVGKKDMDKLRPLGIRGAQEAYTLEESLNSNDTEEKTIAEGNFREIAQALNVTENTLKMLLNEVTEDPYTQFIVNVWC